MTTSLAAAVAPFVLTPDEQHIAQAIAEALNDRGMIEHGAAVMESTLELSGVRRPRAADAWRFFHAARALDGETLGREARALGRLVGLAAIGATVVDGHRIDAGGQTAYLLLGLNHSERAALAYPRPAGDEVQDFPRPMGAR